MTRAILVVVLALPTLAASPVAHAQSPAPPAAVEQKHEPLGTGKGVGLDVSTGLIGVYASVNVGLLLPKLSDRWQIGFRASWSMPAVLIPHPNRDNTDDVEYLPWMVYGSFFFHYGTPPLKDLVRLYFGTEVLSGTIFATVPGLIGKNATVGVIAYGGLEFYAKPQLTVFLEAGVSGVFTFIYDDFGELGRYNQHGGTGFFIRFGGRFYLGKR